MHDCNKILQGCLFILFMVLTSVYAYDASLVQALQNNHVRLIVMRHGEGIHNLQDLMTSSRTPGIYLTKHGKQQVRKSAKRLASEKIDVVYVSPVFRTLQTAHLVTKALKIPYYNIHVEDALREQYFGDFEGKKFQEYMACFAKIEDQFTLGAPNAETGLEVGQRTQQFLWKIALQHPNQTVLVITHCFNYFFIHYCLYGSFPATDLPTADFKVYSF